jgi:hypothetical protein
VQSLLSVFSATASPLEIGWVVGSAIAALLHAWGTYAALAHGGWLFYRKLDGPRRIAVLNSASIQAMLLGVQLALGSIGVVYINIPPIVSSSTQGSTLRSYSAGAAVLAQILLVLVSIFMTYHRITVVQSIDEEEIKMVNYARQTGEMGIPSSVGGVIPIEQVRGVPTDNSGSSAPGTAAARGDMEGHAPPPTRRGGAK